MDIAAAVDEDEDEVAPAADEQPSERSSSFSIFAPERTKEVWNDAVEAALKSVVDDRAIATTILLPSGVGDVVVGLRVVLGAFEAAASELARAVAAAPNSKDRKRAGWKQDELRFRALVVLPRPLLELAERMYEEQLGDKMRVVVCNMNRRKELVDAFRRDSEPVVILAKYEDMTMLSLAQIQASPDEERKNPDPIELLVMESAQIVRAGGYRADGVADLSFGASRRLYISSRRLSGKAPGALLGPGQDPLYPVEEREQKFGQEVFRLTHEKANAEGLKVPLQMVSMQSANATTVALELAALHRETGLRSIQVVPVSKLARKVAEALDLLLRKLTNGACTVTTGGGSEAADLDAILIVSQNPDYAKVAEEFPRLSRIKPGKKYGYILAIAQARKQIVSAWRALAIEDGAVEEAIQTGALEWGKKDHRLKLEEIPKTMRQLVWEGSQRDKVELAVARGIEDLGDPWDVWFGRLEEWIEHNHRESIRIITKQPQKSDRYCGHAIGEWIIIQRRAWTTGQLSPEKVQRLLAMGIVEDKHAEDFARGLVELRRFVREKQTNEVPFTYYNPDNGYQLGSFVVAQKKKQLRGKLSKEHYKALQEAFLSFRQTVSAVFFKHPEDPEAAELTRSIEALLRSTRYALQAERRRQFRKLVLTHHPDVSKDPNADTTMRFLGSVKAWYLDGD